MCEDEGDFSFNFLRHPPSQQYKLALKSWELADETCCWVQLQMSQNESEKILTQTQVLL